MTKLKDIFSKQITGEWGTDPSSKDSVYVLRTTNFTNEGIIDYSNVVQRDVPLAKVQDKQLCKDDIILEKSGGSDNIPVGRVVYCGDEIKEKIYLCNNFTQAMRVNTDIAVPKYVFHYMMFLHKTGRTNLLQRKTTGIRNLQLKSYLNLEIPLPSKSRQVGIADTLDKIDSLTKLNQQRINKLDLLVKSRFKELANIFKDNKMNLASCCAINPVKPKDIADDLDCTFVPMTSVSNTGAINTDCIKPYKDLQKGFTYFAENDVLFAKITPCMENGKGCIAKNLYNKIGFGSTEFHVLRPDYNKLNPYWLYILTVMKEFRLKAALNMTGSAGQRRVPASFLQKYVAVVPDMHVQNQFADFVIATDKSKAEVQKSLAKLEVLKKSLMQEYFG